MPEPVILIIRPEYSIENKLKKDYESQFINDLMLNDKIFKKIN